MKRSTGRRWDMLEVILVCTLAVAIAVTATAWGLSKAVAAPPPPDLQWLRATYGPHKHSQFVEEWIIRDFFRDRRGGTFVDVGAADYRTWSNTYYLEHNLGWSGLAVDPQQSFAAGYAQFRQRTRFRPLFVSDQSDQNAVLYLNDSPWVASSNPEFTSRWGKPSRSATVPTITLNDLLDAEKLTGFDFLSMDIELAEPQALAGFDVKRFRPQLVCIEAHPEVRQQILDYFASNGYTAIGKYLRMDDRNLYFMPLGHPVPPLPRSVMEQWTH